MSDLIAQGSDVNPESKDYRPITKLMKKRANYLASEKLQKEADEMNMKSMNNDIKGLFKEVSRDKSSFRSITPGKCDPRELKEFFEQLFDLREVVSMPAELIDPPEYLEIIKDIPTDCTKTEAPYKSEIVATIRKLKKNKETTDIESETLQATLKSEEILEEVTQIFQDIWQQKSVPKKWLTKNMIAMWKIREQRTEGKALQESVKLMRESLTDFETQFPVIRNGKIVFCKDELK